MGRVVFVCAERTTTVTLYDVVKQPPKRLSYFTCVSAMCLLLVCQ